MFTSTDYRKAEALHISKDSNFMEMIKHLPKKNAVLEHIKLSGLRVIQDDFVPDTMAIFTDKRGKVIQIIDTGERDEPNKDNLR